ncbi:UNVERIFIED_CONTAM: hypothetical protein Sangu_0939500 [Sesamum angustifolium]|uniref:C2H2-type domain-containing protein n=1 Tax=Sesamum angustifolium TaxID=2727405 RepID=A0AAW2PBA1_9LAMI
MLGKSGKFCCLHIKRFFWLMELESKYSSLEKGLAFKNLFNYEEAIERNLDQENRQVRLFQVYCKSERCDSWKQEAPGEAPELQPKIHWEVFSQPIAHEVILSNSRCELKITGFGGFHEGYNGSGGDSGGGGGGGGSTFVGTLRPGTPGPGGHPTMHYFNPSFRNSATPPRKTASLLAEREGLGNGVPTQKRASFGKDSNGSNGVTCHKCGEQFVKWEALESHHLSKHAVTELVEGDSSRKIVEIICRSSWLKSENQCVRIDRVLKVHNMQKTLARFEDYRETVKTKASKLPKKHPRCLADGNELLRFLWDDTSMLARHQWILQPLRI